MVAQKKHWNIYSVVLVVGVITHITHIIYVCSAIPLKAENKNHTSFI